MEEQLRIRGVVREAEGGREGLSAIAPAEHTALEKASTDD